MAPKRENRLISLASDVPASSQALQKSTLTEQDGSQWAVLNGLRFVLAMIVLTGHISSFVHLHNDWTNVGLWLNQGSAVFAFLVVNGYACSDRLARGEHCYFGWRFYRLYPLCLANLILVILAYHVVGADFRYPEGQPMEQPTNAEVLGSLVMFQQFITLVVPLNGQTWSVACDWWLGVLGPSFARYRTLALVPILGASYLMFLVLQHLIPAGMQLWTYGRAFLGGGWIWLTGFMWCRLRGTLLGIVLVTVPTVAAAGAGYFIGIPLLATIGILMLSDRIPVAASLRRPLIWLGDLSFPIYLSHTAVVAVLCHSQITNSIILTVASLAISVLMLYFVDYPARRGLAKLFGERPAAIPVA